MKINDLTSIYDYLMSIGIKPVRRKGNNLIYQSPFRKEAKASFYLDIEKDLWKDFGLSGAVTGGNIITLIKLLDNISGKEAFRRLIAKDTPKNDLYLITESEKKFKFDIVHEGSHLPDKYYELLVKRGLDTKLCLNFLKFIRYSIIFNDKKNSSKFYDALMYRNVVGGYEIITYEGKKLCYYGKSYTYYNRGSKRNLVFEGLFNYIAWLQNNFFESEKYNVFILNGVGMAKRLISDLYNENRHKELFLFYLDNDKPGDECTRFLGDRLVNSMDQRDQYLLYNDYNDYILDRKIKKE